MKMCKCGCIVKGDCAACPLCDKPMIEDDAE